MADTCVCCDDDLDEDDVVTLTEGADLLCMACTTELGDAIEIAYQRKLRDVHPDWRAS
jgi:hypothetical protein